MSAAAKVGAFMLVVLGILGFFVLKIEDLHFGGGKSKTITAVFDDVAGLDAKSAVRVAGVRKGKVTSIVTTPEGDAKVTLEVDEDVQLHQNATARVANLGLLGEKYIELDPGSPKAPLITGDNVILRGTQPASFDDVTEQVSAIAEDVKAITASMRTVMAGPTGQQRLEDIVENVRAITEQVRELIAANRSNVDATMANARVVSEQLRVEIPKLAASIDRVAGSLGGTVNENRQDVRRIVDNLKTLSSDLKVTADNLNAITGQVKSGEGTVGKLIYSAEAHDRLSSALASVESGVTELRNTLGRANRIGLDLGIKADYLAGYSNEDTPFEDFGGTSRSALTLRVTPNPERNRFYNVELADDPRGRKRDKIFETTVVDPNTGAESTVFRKETKYDRDFVISAQAGWLLDDFAVRVGLFDSTGGAGLDYQFNDRIKVTGEAFDFGKRRDDNPHIRVFGEYTVRQEKPHSPRLFVTTGVDNALNDTAFMFGGGIRWKDEDLKYLIGSVPLGK